MLTSADLDLLDFEERVPQHSELKAVRIVETLGLTPSRYYARLRRLTREQDAITRYPLLCARIQRYSERGRAEQAQHARLAS